MSDEALRRHSRGASSPEEVASLAHERCRNGQCCAHRIPVLPVEDPTVEGLARHGVRALRFVTPEDVGFNLAFQLPSDLFLLVPSNYAVLYQARGIPFEEAASSVMRDLFNLSRPQGIYFPPLGRSNGPRVYFPQGRSEESPGR